jgi:5-methylcytosine-specific restriction endonuclease McrA
VQDGRQRVRDRDRYPREAEQRREYARQYLRDHPEEMRAVRRNRKSRIQAQRFQFTEKDWRRMLARYRGCCAYCGEKHPKLQREHVIPIARGGRHSVGNIVPACPRCNGSKKAKLLSEWRYQQRR